MIIAGPGESSLRRRAGELHFIDATVKDIASPRGGIGIGQRRFLIVKVETGYFEAESVEAEHENVEVENESIGQSPRAASVCVVGDN